jgi:hypothetical protein
MRKSLPFALILLATLGASRAAGQEAGGVGAVAGYPASIGILWRALDRVAIRPEASFNGQWSDSSAGQGTPATVSTSGSTTSVGVSALFYFTERDGLRPYFSPRFSYGRSASTTDAASLSGGGSHSTGNAYSVAGSVGAEYTLGRRFAVFGELGLGCSRQTSSLRYSGTTSSGTSTGSSTSFATRSAVGVILWF